MIDGPKWAVFSVEEVDELGHHRVLGASVATKESRLMYESFAERYPHSDIMMVQGAHVMIRSKPGWKLCEGKPR